MSAEFPFLRTTQPIKQNSLPLFKMYAFDFNTFNFVRDGDGHRILLTGNEALKCWIAKTCRTERFKWRAYDTRYGIELYPFINKVMSVGERKAEIQRMIVEALMVNPYIKSIDSITLEEINHGEDLTINVTLTTIYGQMTV